MNTETISSKGHHGHNVKRLREIMGVKQEAIAVELNISQQAVSDLEQKAVIDEEILAKISKVLSIPVEAIKNYCEETTLSFISSTFNLSDTASINGENNSEFNFNPVDKIIELYERINKEKDEKITLYERMLNEKK